MTEPDDKKPEEVPTLGRPTIREVMESVRRAQDEEIKQQVLTQRKTRRTANNKRAEARQDRYKKEARTRQIRLQRELEESRGKMANHITSASAALRAALKDATSVAFPRHSPHGREQIRMQRSIESALAALRQVGRGTFHVPDIEDVGT